NEKIKKILIYFLIIGVFWNLIGGMNYRPAREFLKMERYLPLIFYIYPIMKRDKRILRNFLIVTVLGYSYLLKTVTVQYLGNVYRASGLSDINTTGLFGAIVGSVAGAMAISEKKISKKILYIGLFLSGIFITVATQGRGPLLSIVVAVGVSIGLHIYIKTSFKDILKIFIVIFIGVGLVFKNIPPEKLGRFSNIFNTEKSYENVSNGLRVEMWKNAVWRIKQNPIFGSGTKYDKEDLFQKYVQKMPETTELERYYKNIFKSGFDDAHSMYLNAAVDNGLFILYLCIIWFGIPSYFIKYKLNKIENKEIAIATLSGIVSFQFQGLFWPIWRKHNQSLFWLLLAILIYTIYSENKVKDDERPS
ncbi:MAG: O-antigen ligase family protein, partial [Cetobacterium sp.]